MFTCKFYTTELSAAEACARVKVFLVINPLNAELNPICHLLALLGAHPILHVSRIRFKLTTYRVPI